MSVRALGYIDIGVSDMDAWRSFGHTLGIMEVPAAEGFAMKIDRRPFRVVLSPTSEAEGLAWAGWEVADAEALERIAAGLERAGVAVTTASEEDCATRKVRGMVRLKDPAGFGIEIFHGPILEHDPFLSPAGVSGFVTGSEGLGHIVLGTPNVAESAEFYRRELGFRVSDYWRPAGEDVIFLRCNRRHHSLALVPATQPALYHFMLEARTLDDVGTTLDRHHDANIPISMGLGKHTNDQMTSFYGQTPSGFDVEFGCGGLLVDEATWTVAEITEPSLWGHRRPASA